MTNDRPERADAGRPSVPRRRVLVAGATGTIGRATGRALVARGHEVTSLVRRPHEVAGATASIVDVADPSSLSSALAGRRFDALVSCLASRTGVDAWAVDHRANANVLDAARRAGVGQVVLLSALCVQKPRLAFQHAKLAFERELVESGLAYSIVRPTAFFKSLSGQVARVAEGRPYLMFGDGTLTATKPISDDDCAAYLADCLDDPSRHDRVLPIGGPGPALTPRDIGHALFTHAGREPRFRQVPVAVLDAAVGGLTLASRVAPRLAAKAELARIGRYYATESMLVLDPATGRYDPAATPSTGSETLADYHARLLAGTATLERGEHAVF